MELREIGSSTRSSFNYHASSFRVTPLERSFKENEDEDEVELEWAAIERLPTFERIRMSLFENKLLNDNNLEEGKSMVDVKKLGALERHVFIEKLLEDVEEDNRRLLQKLKKRIDRQLINV